MTEQTQNTTEKTQSMTGAKKSSVDEDIDETIRNIFLDEGGDKNNCPKSVTLDMLARAMGAELTPRLNDVGIQVERANIGGLWSAYYTVMNLEYLTKTTDYEFPITDIVHFGGESMSSSPIDPFQSMWESVGGYEPFDDGSSKNNNNNNNNSKKSSE